MVRLDDRTFLCLVEGVLVVCGQLESFDQFNALSFGFSFSFVVVVVLEPAELEFNVVFCDGLVLKRRWLFAGICDSFD